MSGPTYLSQIPNQLHCMPRGALEVLGTILVAICMPVIYFKIILFIECHVFRLAPVTTQHLLLTAALL